MIKSDYGHFGVPFYEQKLPNGLKVLFLPKKGGMESAMVYLSQGGYLHDEKIEESKIPFGTAYYVGKTVMDSSFQEELLAHEALGEERSDLSYTYFQVTSSKNIFVPLSLLMKRLSDMNFQESKLEEIKGQYFDQGEKIRFAQKECLKDLYFSSPIRMGVVPSREESVPIHVTALRKFLQRYYVPSRVTLIICSDTTPNACMEEIKKLRLPKENPTGNKEFLFDEDYATVRSEYRSLTAKDGDLFVYGVKFAPREKIFEKFGQLMFMAYEVLGEMLFAKNEIFQKGLLHVDSDLLSYRFEEGGEDSCLLLTLRTKTPVALQDFLVSYFHGLEKKIDRKFFSTSIEEKVALAVEKMRNPRQLIKLFASAYANNLPYTSLLTMLSRMSFKSFREFLKELSSYPHSSFFLREEGK